MKYFAEAAETMKTFGSSMYTQKVDFYGPADGNISFVRGTYEIKTKGGHKIPFSEGKYVYMCVIEVYCINSLIVYT